MSRRSAWNLQPPSGAPPSKIRAPAGIAAGVHGAVAGVQATPVLVTSAQQVLVEQVLVTLLLAAGLLVLAQLGGQRRQVGQAQLAGGEVGTGAAVEAGVT